MHAFVEYAKLAIMGCWSWLWPAGYRVCRAGKELAGPWIYLLCWRAALRALWRQVPGQVDQVAALDGAAQVGPACLQAGQRADVEKNIRCSR